MTKPTKPTKPTPPSTYAHHASLPRLPVPKLADTMERYLASLQPFLTAEELATTTAVAKDFARPGGVGEDMQRVLLQRAKDHPNWLHEWWHYAAYLSDRTPIAPYISMITGFGSFQDFDHPVSQPRRAAETVRYTCEYLQMLQREQLPPETMGGRVLCMDMFTRLFASCRIPGDTVDHFERRDPREVGHIMVTCDGFIFTLPVYDDDNELLTIGDLETQFLYILQHAQYLSKSKPAAREAHGDGAQHIGALTAMDRSAWASARHELLAMGGYNADNLTTIQQSLFAICLDRTAPATPSALVHACSAENSGNRWYDKSFQYVVFGNGMLGANMEHGNVDATVLQSMFRWLGERYRNRAGGYETFIESRHHSTEFLPPPELLKWQLPDRIKQLIPTAVTHFNESACAVRTLVKRNKTYGKDMLKKVRLFPDTFVQMALQLASYKLWGEVVPTYESAHTRVFYLGRTETIRTVTTEVQDWLQAAVRDHAPEAVVHEKLQRAMAKHKTLTASALMGQGVDRHLLGLQMAGSLAGLPTHALFTDPGFVKSGGGGNFVLSSSNVSGYAWLWGGFVPMVPHGIGACYVCEPDFLGFLFSSFDENPHERKVVNPRPRFTVDQFQAVLWESMDEIYALASKFLDQAPAQKPKQKRQAKI